VRCFHLRAERGGVAELVFGLQLSCRFAVVVEAHFEGAHSTYADLGEGYPRKRLDSRSRLH